MHVMMMMMVMIEWQNIRNAVNSAVFLCASFHNLFSLFQNRWNWLEGLFLYCRRHQASKQWSKSSSAGYLLVTLCRKTKNRINNEHSESFVKRSDAHIQKRMRIYQCWRIRKSSSTMWNFECYSLVMKPYGILAYQLIGYFSAKHPISIKLAFCENARILHKSHTRHIRNGAKRVASTFVWFVCCFFFRWTWTDEWDESYVSWRCGSSTVQSLS